jgi:small subunit ribosomal protein S8
MSMTDPIADMLTRLRNANSAYHDTVGKNLVVTLKFGNARERSIAGIKRVSKPGLRVYAKKDNLPRVLGGLGVAIISTSSGLMTDRQAKRSGVGGEVLAYVW